MFTHCSRQCIYVHIKLIYTILNHFVQDNIARSGTAEQSTTLWYGVPKQFDWNASLALDGDKSERKDINSEARCSGTDKQDNPWWQLDLHTDHEIGKVNIYGRLDNAGLSVYHKA